jgi:hypothetical protein
MPAGWGPRREAATVKAGWLPSYGSQLASLSPRGEKGSRNGRWLVGCTGNYRRFVRLRRTQRNATRPHQTNRVAVLDTGRLADLAARGENPKNSRPDSFPLRSVETKGRGWMEIVDAVASRNGAAARRRARSLGQLSTNQTGSLDVSPTAQMLRPSARAHILYK